MPTAQCLELSVLNSCVRLEMEMYFESVLVDTVAHTICTKLFCKCEHFLGLP